MYQQATRAVILTTVIFFLSLAGGQARRRTKHSDYEGRLEDDMETFSQTKEIHSGPKEKIPWHKYAKIATSYSKNGLNEDESSYCHKVALKRCGNSFMKVFQLFTFLPEDQSFQAKCASRTAFYSCLKKFSTRPCMSSWHFHIEEKFRKRLADNLWSARTCVLGILPPSRRNHDDVKH